MCTEYQEVCYDDIRYSVTEINRNFKIKVVGMNAGCPVERIVGVSGLMDEVGDNDIVNSLIERAFSVGADKVVCKLRRGLKIIFYSH